MHETQGDWLPARAALHPTGLYFSLREIEPAELQDAFMQQTLARVSARETVRADRARGPRQGHRRMRAGGTHLPCRALRLDAHLAVAQAAGDLVVYAEPLPVNEILVPPHKWSRVELVAALRSLGAAFARHAQKSYVLKFTSWNTLFCDIVTEAFPQSPWVLSYRDPVEVGVSLLRQPPGWIWADGGEPAAPFARHVDPEGRVQFARRICRANLRRVLRCSVPPRSVARPRS